MEDCKCNGKYICKCGDTEDIIRIHIPNTDMLALNALAILFLVIQVVKF